MQTESRDNTSKRWERHLYKYSYRTGKYVYLEYMTLSHYDQWPNYKKKCLVDEYYSGGMRKIMREVYVSDQPKHRACAIMCISPGEHIDLYNGEKAPAYRFCTEQEIIDAVMTSKNSCSSARREQAAVLANAGYGGPVGGAEARALKSIMAEIGLPENVKRGHALVDRKGTITQNLRGWTRRNALSNGQPTTRRVERSWTALTACYVFKSPLDNVPWESFIRLARGYRGDKGGLRAAINTILADPSKANEMIDALDTIDLLAEIV